MKYLKMWKQVFEYTSNVKYERNLYYSDQVKEIINDDWYNISVSKQAGVITINFENDKYIYHALLERNGSNDEYYLENPSEFIEKFKKEFFKKPHEYVDNLKYDPKCLGDLDYIRNANKYNM